MTSGHVNTDRLIDMVNGSLPRPEIEVMAAHCASCVRCGDQLAVFLLLRKGVRRQRAGRLRLVQVAAALIVLVGLGSIAGSLLYRSQALPAASSWSEFATSEGLDPRLVHSLFGDALLVGVDPFPFEKLTAFRQLVDGDLNNALRGFRNLHAMRPADSEVAAYLGIAMYLAGETTRDVEVLLTQGLEAQMSTIQRYSQWYLANHFLRNQRPDRAIEILQPLARSADRPGRQAKALMDDLAGVNFLEAPPNLR